MTELPVFIAFPKLSAAFLLWAAFSYGLLCLPLVIMIFANNIDKRIK